MSVFVESNRRMGHKEEKRCRIMTSLFSGCVANESLPTKQNQSQLARNYGRNKNGLLNLTQGFFTKHRADFVQLYLLEFAPFWFDNATFMVVAASHSPGFIGLMISRS